MPYDPNNPNTMMKDGKLYVWQPDTQAAEEAAYLGLPAPEVDPTPGVGPGSWVPASYDNPNGTLFGPKWMLPAMLAGPAIASGIGALAGAGGAGVAPAATSAAAAAPGLPAAVAGLPAGMTAGAVPMSASGFAAAAAPAATGGTLRNILKGSQMAGRAAGALNRTAASNRGESDLFGQRNAQLELQREQLGLGGYNANTSAQSALEAELMRRADVEGSQRKTDLSNIYKESVASNPTASPYNTRGLPTLSQAYKDAIASLAKQGGTELAQDPAYRVRNLKQPTMTPYVQPPFTLPTQTKKGTLENVTDWLSPLLSGVGAFA